MSEYLKNVETAEAQVRAAKKQLSSAERAKKAEIKAAEKRLQAAEEMLSRPQKSFAGISLYPDHLEYQNQRCPLEENIRTDIRIDDKVSLTVSTGDTSFTAVSDAKNETRAREFAADIQTAAANARWNKERAEREIAAAREELQRAESDRTEIESCRAVLKERQDNLAYLHQSASPHEAAALHQRNKSRRKRNSILGAVAALFVLAMLSSVFGKKPQTETVSTPAVRTEEKKKEEADKSEPAEEIKTEEPAPEPETPAEESAPADGIRPEFREAMESYEAFFDEYVAFMEAADDENTSADYLMKYYDYLAKYTDAMEKLEAVDESELSPQEDILYLETMNRINVKLMKAAQ